MPYVGLLCQKRKAVRYRLVDTVFAAIFVDGMTAVVMFVFVDLLDWAGIEMKTFITKVGTSRRREKNTPQKRR